LYPVYEGLYSFSPEGGRQHFPEEHVNIQMQVGGREKQKF